MAEPRRPDALDDDELATWSSLATLLEWLPAALDAQLQRDSEMSHFEFGILFALSRAEDGTLRMSTLAAYANSTLSRLSRAVARLERRGWAKREPDPADGRFTLAILTPEGEAARGRAEPGHVALVRRLVLDPLGAHERAQLRQACRTVTEGISADTAWAPGDEGLSGP
jgi:DNA-binding MarR family transcriptional regulator